jgi:amidase
MNFMGEGPNNREACTSRRQALLGIGSAALVALQSACFSKESNPASPASSQSGKQPAMEPLHYSSLRDIARRIQSKEISPVELANHMLDRIAAVDPKLKSYATVMRDQALEAAKRAEEEIQRGSYRGPLHGVPIAVKDLCYTKGVRTMAGTSIYANFIPDHDATVVTKLDQAGAILLGKLNLTEGAMTGYNPARDIPVNPWREDVWAGVSSSGSGVATAAGLCYGSIGTDTGGSIRYPSAANGIVGLKPTYGRVSRYGVFPLAESLDHIGPMVRRAGDAAVMFEAIAGFDSNDPTSLRDPVPHMLDELDKGVRGLRIGFDRRFAIEGIHPEQSAAIEGAVDALRRLGAQIVDVQMPDLTNIRNKWLILCAKEALAAHAKTFPSRKNEYGPYFREFLEMGAAVSAGDYANAVQYRKDLSTKYRAVLSIVDAFAYPAGNGGAFSISKETQYGSMADFNAARDKYANSYNPPLGALVYTYPADLSGTPTITLPVGFSSEGLPLSMQFAGQALSEPTLCRIGHAYEQATGWYKKHPKV